MAAKAPPAGVPAPPGYTMSSLHGEPLGSPNPQCARLPFMQELRSVSSQPALQGAPKLQHTGRAAQMEAVEAKPSSLGAAAEAAAPSHTAPTGQGGKAKGGKAMGGRPKPAAAQPAAKRAKKGSSGAGDES